MELIDLHKYNSAVCSNRNLRFPHSCVTKNAEGTNPFVYTCLYRLQNKAMVVLLVILFPKIKSEWHQMSPASHTSSARGTWLAHRAARDEWPPKVTTSIPTNNRLQYNVRS